jgi:UDP-N-acetylmuramoyl-L-alanyl-D-glutamate--2,6-diaminopimelate ligase
MPIDNFSLEHQSIAPILGLHDVFIDDVATAHITLDSRKVESKDIFIAVSGESFDGRQYIDSAILLGASLVIVDTDDIDTHSKVQLNKGVQVVYFYELTKHLGQIVSQYYCDASRKLLGIAVTGTNGKTSVAHLVASLSALIGTKAGTIGTMGVQFFANNNQILKIADTINTTPDVVSAHMFCGLLKNRGAERFCIEASSHGLHQNRLQGLKITTGIFTNLTQDHLDYHETMEKYASAKRRLVAHHGLNSLVINIDDAEGENWLKAAGHQKDICLYSCAEERPQPFDEYSYLWANKIRYMHSGCTFSLESSWGKCEINLPLIGNFNIYNVLAALGALIIQGESLDELAEAVSLIRGVPGRMELFESSQHANIIVDYAHTPDALKQALISAKQHTMGSLIVVFGCGGDRDASKRAKMGIIAQKWADITYLTQDNSRSESPIKIINDIKSGMKDGTQIHIEINREDAIKQAYLGSKNGDLIVVAGKGHEEYLELNGVREYYNERDYVNKLTSGTTL